MKDDNYSLLLLEPKKSNKEEDSEYDLKHYKTIDKYKIYNYEKFKPKVKENTEENEKVLKGAENQVKNLLSSCIRNFQSEKHNSGTIYKQVNSNSIEPEGSSCKKKVIKKVRTAAFRKYKKENSNNSIGNKNLEINHLYQGTSPKFMFSRKSNKKVNFSISPRVKRKRNYSQKGKTNVKFINSNKNNDNAEKVLAYKLENMKKEIHKANRMHSGKNIKFQSNNLFSNKNNRLNNNSLIKKTNTQHNINNYINFKDDEFISNNNEKKDRKFYSFKNLIANSIKKLNFNKKKIKQSNSINPLKLSRLQSEDNIYISNKTQICPSPKSKKSSLFRKKESTLFKEKSDLKSELENVGIKPKKSYNFEKIVSFQDVKRSGTSKYNLNSNSQNEDKIKFLNLISNFKELKHKLKQNIILRPEDQEKRKKKFKFSSPRIKPDEQNASDRIIHKKLEEIEETPKNNNEDSQRSNTIIYMGEQNSGLGAVISKDKSYTEGEMKQEEEKQERKKSESYHEVYSTHTIKRKNVIHLEKYRILSHKGIIYDSLDDEEIDDEEDINIFYIDPNSNFCFCFDLILFIINIITFFEIPFYLAMNLNFCKAPKFSINDTINLLAEGINILDFFFGFFRAYYNWEEQLVKKNDVIAKKYLWGWFLFDLISAIPVYTLTKIYESSCNENSNALYYNTVLDNIHYFLINNRLFKLVKIFSYNQGWKYISNIISDFWSLIFSICFILLALNYTACFYIFVARNSYPNWILKAGLEESEFKNIYICSIYILLMALTTVGYGDITCCSFRERIFQVFLLIIGIIGYSWLVSSFSNFIQKLNEKSVDFEKKKSILDEIKINNPNLPDDLYDRILRYLKFKYFHEKNLKSIIFDCLPVGLKNNLIYEMYKPVINNFIFFKNFQYTDFIVQVILSFKPIIAYKNDILINEGDLIEEIIFVKKGVLSAELPINMTNPQENIDKYLTIPNLDKEKENSKFKKSISNIKNDTIASLFGSQTPKKLYSLANTSTVNSSFQYKSSFIGNQTLSKIKTVKIQKAYVKILGIRENEHFGDVLMFLEERSPLQLRVRSKKCELFFLKKIDALKISTSYPNIWRRINKKSVYNFKQIKKNIRKIVEIYCSVKKVNDKKSENLSNEIEEFGLKPIDMWEHPKNYDFNNSALKSTKRNFSDNLSKSENELGNSAKKIISRKYGIEEEYFNIDNVKKEIMGHKKSHSVKVSKTNFNSLFFPQNELMESSFHFSDSSSSSIDIKVYNPKKKDKKKYNLRTKKKKITKKIMDVFNSNYTYYKGINQKNHDNYPITIIAEETDKECSINPMLNTNRNSVDKNTYNSKNKLFDEQSLNSFKKKDKKNRKNKKKKEKHVKIKQSLFGLNSIKINNFESVKNPEFLINSSDYDSNKYYNEINEEIYPGELIEIHGGESLLDKKLDINDNKQFDLENNFNINSNIELNNRNQEITKLLKYFDKESRSNNNSISQKPSIKDKSSRNFFKKENHSNKLIFNHEEDSNSECSKNGISSLNLKPKWDINTLSISTDISLTINSSYENCIFLTGGKLIKSKYLQNKLKEILINESFNAPSTDGKNNSIRKTSSAEQNAKYKKKSILNNLSRKKSLASSIVYNTTNINYINKVSFMKNKPKKNVRRASSLMQRHNTKVSNPNFENSSSNFALDNKKNVDQIKNDKNDIKQMEPESFISTKNIMKFNKRSAKKKSSVSYIKSSHNIKHFDISPIKFNPIDPSINGKPSNYETTKDIPRRLRMKRRNSVLISAGLNRGKRKKDNLLSLIDYNIQRTNQKLNDPEAFYNDYFHNILKKEKEKNKKKQ